MMTSFYGTLETWCRFSEANVDITTSHLFLLFPSVYQSTTYTLLMKMAEVITIIDFHISTDTRSAFTERGPKIQVKIDSLVQSWQRLKNFLLSRSNTVLILNPDPPPLLLYGGGGSGLETRSNSDDPSCFY